MRKLGGGGVEGFSTDLKRRRMQIYADCEFPKIRDTLFWGPRNKDPTI